MEQVRYIIYAVFGLQDDIHMVEKFSSDLYKSENNGQDVEPTYDHEKLIAKLDALRFEIQGRILSPYKETPYENFYFFHSIGDVFELMDVGIAVLEHGNSDNGDHSFRQLKHTKLSFPTKFSFVKGKHITMTTDVPEKYLEKLLPGELKTALEMLVKKKWSDEISSLETTSRRAATEQLTHECRKLLLKTYEYFLTVLRKLPDPFEKTFEIGGTMNKN